MTSTTNAQRQAAYKARQRAAGLAEVRGIWARPADHAAIKAAAKQISNHTPRYDPHQAPHA